MSTALTDILHLGRGRRLSRRAERRRQEAQQVTFADLAWDHYHWEQRRLTGSTREPESANHYRDTRAAFEARHGEIVSEYWSVTQPSGVALTRKRAPLLLRLIVDDVRRLHRATDWVTRDCPLIADVVFTCETLAIKVTEVLRYTSESVAMREIVAVASDLLGFIDRAAGKPEPAQVEQVAARQQREVDRIEGYYRRAGVRIGRMVYTQGMLIGLFLLAGLAALVMLVLQLAHVGWNHDSQTLLVAYASGSVGALVSVLQRMSSDKFGVHYDLGKRNLYMLGSYRPVLGAVFGVFTYFVFAGGLLSTTAPPTGTKALYYFGALAFVAGFSERFTKVLIKEASKVAGGGGGSTSQAEGESR